MRARRRACVVADGSAYNWSIHRGYFADFEPITDFLRTRSVTCTPSACAVSVDEPSGWSQYLVWMRACWQGRVRADVLVELDRWQERLGEPPVADDGSAEARGEPRRVVYKARTYLRNNQKRSGLTVVIVVRACTDDEQFGGVSGWRSEHACWKSKQKYWTRGVGSESILQLRAAVLSQDDRLTRFFANRPGCPFRKKRRTDNTTRNYSLHKPRRDLYEGLTNYIGWLLAARCGLMSPEESRDYLAMTAARMTNVKARGWRPLDDTAAAASTLFDATRSWRLSARRGGGLLRRGHAACGSEVGCADPRADEGREVAG